MKVKMDMDLDENQARKFMGMEAKRNYGKMDKPMSFLSKEYSRVEKKNFKYITQKDT